MRRDQRCPQYRVLTKSGSGGMYEVPTCSPHLSLQNGARMSAKDREKAGQNATFLVLADFDFVKLTTPY